MLNLSVYRTETAEESNYHHLKPSVTPDNLTPLLRVLWDPPDGPSAVPSSPSTSADGDALLSTNDETWLRRMAYSGWKDLKIHFAELEALRCRGDAAGLGPNLFPAYQRRLAILRTILQMQQLLGCHGDVRG